MYKAISKVLLLLEALFGGIYVSATRGTFIPMVAYAGYSVEEISLVLMLSAIGGVAVSYVVYVKLSSLTGRGRALLMIMHVSERFFWCSLPIFLAQVELISIVYLLGQVTSILTSILLTALILEGFDEKTAVEMFVSRAAFSSAASLIGSIMTTYIAAIMPAPDRYYLIYFGSGSVGLLSSIFLMFVKPQGRGVAPRRPEVSLEVEVKKVSVYVMLTFMFLGSNLLALGWPPLLRDIGAPLWIAVALNVSGGLGGMVGPYIWRSYKQYALAVLLNSITVLFILSTSAAYVHLLISFILSVTFVGANLIATSIYSRYVEAIGSIKASTLLISSNMLGLFFSTLLGAVAKEPSTLILLSFFSRIFASILTLIAIPEAAIVPYKTAYGYARLIYSTSLIGYTLTVETSKEVIKLAVKVLALTLVIGILIFIYRLLHILLTI